MPLLRTPPEKGKTVNRAHTFLPEQAYPDGTPLPPDLEAQLATPMGAGAGPSQPSSLLGVSHMSQPDPTPTRGPSLKASMLAPAPSLEPLDEREEAADLSRLSQMAAAGNAQHAAEQPSTSQGEAQEEMDIDAGLGTAVPPSSEPATPKTHDEREASATPKASLAASRAPRTPSQTSARSHPQSQSQRTPSRSASLSTSQRGGTSQPTPSADAVLTETPRRRSARHIPPPLSPPTATPAKRPLDEVEVEATAVDEGTQRTPTPPPVTPRRQSRARTPKEVLREAPVPIADVGDAQYGRYYESLVRTLRINAIDRGMSKLTLEQLAACYPLLAEEKGETLQQVWTSALNRLRSGALRDAEALLEEYRVGPRLQRFGDVIDDARAWAAEHGAQPRPDAWQPDLTPQILTTAKCLPVYDESWRILREEYLELAQECSERLRRVQEKRARLASIDNGVSDAVVELGKTTKLFDDFPTTQMLEWAEDVGAE